MANDHKPAQRRGAAFDFGVAELARSEQAEAPGPRSVTLEVAPPKGGGEGRGFDPYNSTGGFDRKKNWVQVRKR